MLHSATLQHRTLQTRLFFKNYHSLEPLRQQHNKPPPPLRTPTRSTNASGCRTLLATCGTQTHVDEAAFHQHTITLLFFDDRSVTHTTDRVTNQWGLCSLDQIRVCTPADWSCFMCMPSVVGLPVTVRRMGFGRRTSNLPLAREKKSLPLGRPSNSTRVVFSVRMI